MSTDRLMELLREVDGDLAPFTLLDLEADLVTAMGALHLLMGHTCRQKHANLGIGNGRIVGHGADEIVAGRATAMQAASENLRRASDRVWEKMHP